MIRIERVTLPAGLRAIAERDADGVLVIYVAQGLDARRQRAAVREAVRASRRAGWRGGLPVGIAALGSVRLLLRRAAARFHAQPAATAGWAGAAAAVIAGGVAGVLVLSMAAGPHRPARSLAPRPGVGISAPARPSGRPGREPTGAPRRPGRPRQDQRRDGRRWRREWQRRRDRRPGRGAWRRNVVGQRGAGRARSAGRAAWRADDRPARRERESLAGPGAPVAGPDGPRGPDAGSVSHSGAVRVGLPAGEPDRAVS